ncbi:Low-density lipoprotein receptor-related protein 10 [Nibea albiflora]|uniref:Low-density lipoprotein receptor-related protein 10 n=1 Tax=Nibea albiflora TaxID=240163 RepID=A0ACB7EWE6_NIBAL|nr:Low-density lipoprotein receptor-related protein 10 [Nibea albiflora]
MTAAHNLCALLVFTITVRCGHSFQVLDSQVGQIRSSAYHSWSYGFGSSCDCWVIKGSEGEPVVLSFSQFSARCRKEWVSIKSSAGGEPVVLCGSKLPQPLEFPGGNITVTHHFLPHQFPVSSFLLNYARDSGECPVTSFECLGGRCLPLSWRCNGQVEYGHKVVDKRPERDPLWELLNDREKEEAQVDREQLQTRRGLAVTPTPIQWPCGGLHQTFYGTFSPPAIRGPALFCVWTLDPQDSRPLRLDLQQLVLGPGDRLTVYNREQGKGDIIKIITSASNYKSVQVESHTGLLSLTYETLPGSEGSGFNATFHCRELLPPLGGPLRGSGGRLLHSGAALRREVGLPRDGEGRAGLPGLRSQPVRLWGGGPESGGVQPFSQQAGVLPGHREMQLPAVLRRRQRREGLHRVSAGDLSL